LAYSPRLCTQDRIGFFEFASVRPANNGGFADIGEIPLNFKQLKNSVPNLCQTQVTSCDLTRGFDSSWDRSTSQLPQKFLTKFGDGNHLHTHKLFERQQISFASRDNKLTMAINGAFQNFVIGRAPWHSI
jgi:hypothetical protein